MRAATVALLLVSSLGCKQRGADLCPAWTIRVESGACLARPWTLPSAGSGVLAPNATLRGLAVDGKGRGVAVWERSAAGRTTIEVAEEGAPGAWTAREPLPGINSAPSLAASVDGAAVLTWVHAGDSRSGVIIGERGASGAFHEEVTPFAPEAVEPFITVSPRGDWLLTWCQRTRGGWGVAIARRASEATTWQRPADAEDVVSPSTLFANQPRAAIDAQGDAVVAWYQAEGVPLMTYVSESRAGARFSHPATQEHLSASGAAVASDPVANPKAALGPRGEAAVAWVQDNAHGAVPVFLATRDDRGAWTRPSSLDDSFSRGAGVASGVELVFTRDSELIVAWIEDGVAYAARRRAGESWALAGQTPVRLSSPSSTAYGLTLATGERGGVVATWAELDPSEGPRIAARRTRASGAVWEALEALSAPHAGEVGAPRAAMGPGDRTIVAWSSGPPSAARIVFARVE